VMLGKWSMIGTKIIENGENDMGLLFDGIGWDERWLCIMNGSMWRLGMSAEFFCINTRPRPYFLSNK
jgi:hypothetical protein